MNEDPVPKNDDHSGRRIDTPGIIAAVFGSLLIASAIAVRTPVTTTGVRLLLVVTLGTGLLTGLAYLIKLFAPRPKSLYPALFLLALFLVWVVLGSKPPNTELLRQAYVKRLTRFVGVRYVLGGETDKGIDCSGLARVAMWQATLYEGVKAANPRMLGPRLWRFWFRDLSAGDIKDGKYGYTTVIGSAPKLAGYDTSALVAGDIAVIQDGQHLLIYLGDNRWIDASPDLGRVVVTAATEDAARKWFDRPVTLVRWRVLTP